MFAYLGEIWRKRHFWLSLVRMDLRARYRKSVLGIGWTLVQPLMMTALLCLVFHKLFQVEIHEFAPYLLCGLACWNFLLHSTLQGCQCYYANAAYIRQYPAPLAIYPLRTTLGLMLHFLITLAVVLMLSIVLHGLPNPTALLSLVLGLLLWFLFAWSLAVIAGTANTYFRDVQHLMEVGFQVLFYATPIMYPARLLHDNHLGWLLQINPLIPFLELMRQPILYGKFPDVWSLLTSAGVAFLALSLAGLTLARIQRRLVFHL
jgi:lipopolysaccharide transport system permease protein